MNLLRELIKQLKGGAWANLAELQLSLYSPTLATVHHIGKRRLGMHKELPDIVA